MLNGPRSRILAQGLRTSVLLLAVPIALFTAAYVLGTRLPEEHTATVSGIVEAPPSRVWELLTDVAAQPTWHQPPLTNTRVPFDPAAPHDCWYESWLIDRFPLCATDIGQTHRVLTSTRPLLRFVATWTFDLAPASARQTSLTITEQTSIDLPIWRFIGHYILRRHTAAAAYLHDVQTEAIHRR